MRGVLIALAMIAATVFMAAQALAQEDSEGSDTTLPPRPRRRPLRLRRICHPHEGPVFFEGIEEQWGDIIPTFEQENEFFPGLSWDSDGQAIFFNDCQVPGDDGDGDDDDGDDGDGDDDDGDNDDNGGALPDTGGQPPWLLLTGGFLSVLGIAPILSNVTLGREQVVGRHVRL